MAKQINISMSGKETEALVAVPGQGGPFPGVLVCYHGPGLDAFTENVLDRLAEAGYVALAPHFFHRAPSDIPIPEKVATLNDPEILDDINVGVTELQTYSQVDVQRLAILGHCLGGRNSLLGAAATDHFSACAVFYGGNIMAGRGREAPTPFDLIGDINCPVIGFFGNDDDNPSPEDVDKIDAEMDRLDIEHTFHRYEGAGHAFQNFVAEERYRPKASEDAQEKLIDLFDSVLK